MSLPVTLYDPLLISMGVIFTTSLIEQSINSTDVIFTHYAITVNKK